MKKRSVRTPLPNEFWVARGSLEYEAWIAHARSEGRTIPEYESAVMHTTGFWRRSKFPPGHAQESRHDRAPSSASRRTP
jgi:hypothetical protein